MELNDFLVLSLLTTHQFFFFSVGVVETQCGEMSRPQGDECLEYNFKFDKLGLEPIEYDQCLKSKLDSFLDGQSDDIKNLAKKSVINVEQVVRVRQTSGKKDSKMDERFKATQLYIDEGYLESKHDTPRKRNNRSGGSQNNEEEETKKWTKTYHENQKRLLEENELVSSRLSPLDPNNKSTVHFCNAIDGVTAKLIRDLSDGGQLNSTEVEEVCELCGLILRGRTAVDWAIENNLFIDRLDEWKNHVLALMSFSALMVVADMIHRKLEGRSCVKRTARNIFPVKKAGLGSLVFFVTAVPMYFGAYNCDYSYDVLHGHIAARWVAFALFLFSFVYIPIGYFNYFYFSTFFVFFLFVCLILNHFFPAQS